MSTHSADLVSLEELRSVLNSHAGPDDPRKRPAQHRLGRLRPALVAAVAVAALAGAGVAIAAGVGAFEGTPAPHVIQQNFVRLDAQAAAREYALAKAGFNAQVPRADASKAHGVLQLQTGDGPLDLWAAPATDGGMCWFIGWESDLDWASGAYGYGRCAPDSSASGKNLDWGEVNLPEAHPNYDVVDGYVYGDAATVDVLLADGRTASLPVVENLFLGALEHGDGGKIVSLTAKDANGNVVGSSTGPAS
jgi:hypothetical protein